MEVHTDDLDYSGMYVQVSLAAHLAYELFSWYKYLIVSLVVFFPISGFFVFCFFWIENLFLIAPFPDLCLLVPFYIARH